MVNKTTDDTKVTKKTTKKTTRRKPSKKKDAAAKKPLSEKERQALALQHIKQLLQMGAEEGQPDVYGNHEPHGRRRTDAGPDRQDV